MKEEAATAVARECRLLHEEDAGGAEDKHVRVTLLLTASDASVEIEEHGSAARLCLQTLCWEATSDLDPPELGCFLSFNYLIYRLVKFCLHKPAEAEIKASGASAVIEFTRAWLLDPLSFLKCKWQYHGGCMDLVCLKSRRKSWAAAVFVKSWINGFLDFTDQQRFHLITRLCRDWATWLKCLLISWRHWCQSP